MKILFFTLLTAFSMNALATVDELTSGWIVVQSVQDEKVFGVKLVPIMGCYGLAQGPQLTQFVSRHNIRATMGCGGNNTSVIDINALSCGVVTSSVENPDFASFRRITINISKCPYKNNSRFITMVRTAAARNFPQTQNGKIVPGKEVQLILTK